MTSTVWTAPAKNIMRCGAEVKIRQQPRFAVGGVIVEDMTG
jgi:hypothetical protein